MPVREVRCCLGRSGVACRFSTSCPGKPENVGVGNSQCEICKEKPNKKILAQSLAHLFIIDYDFYQIALSRLPPDTDGARHARVTRRYRAICPAPNANYRRVRTHVAIDRMLDSIMYRIPLFTATFKLCAIQIRLCNMIRMVREFPPDVFENICGNLVVDAVACRSHLSWMKFRGYSL